MLSEFPSHGHGQHRWLLGDWKRTAPGAQRASPGYGSRVLKSLSRSKRKYGATGCAAQLLTPSWRSKSLIHEALSLQTASSDVVRGVRNGRCTSSASNETRRPGQYCLMPTGDAFRRPVTPSPARSGPLDTPFGPPDTESPPTDQPWSAEAGFTDFDWAFVRCFPAASRWATEILLAATRRDQHQTVVEGEAAFTYLVTLRDAMVSAATDVTTTYDATSWLYLIRRLNPLALALASSDSLQYQSDETERVAENLAGNADGELVDFRATAVSTDVSMRLARLMALALMANSLESAIRSANKGVKYLVRRNRKPRPVESDSLREALREFDLRNNWRSADEMPRLETITGDVFSGDPPMLVAYRLKDGIAPDQTWSGPFRGSTLATEPVQFTVRAFTTNTPTRSVLGEHGVLENLDAPSVSASLIIFGNALLHHVINHHPEAGQSLPHFGTLHRTTSALLDDLDDALGKLDIAQWLAANGQAALTSVEIISNVRGLYEHGRRSLPGPILRECHGEIVIDAWAYVWHLIDALQLSPQRGGAIANLNATQFELATQALIDASVYAPPPELRDLRGRTLRRNGQSITDADAILVAGGKAFLVSCKNFVVRLDYMAGEYTAARNARSRLESALDDWRSKIATLRATPTGDNYDLSGYEIEGFILLPELLFTPRSDSRELLRFGRPDLFFTRVESYAQFAATLEMARWPRFGPQSLPHCE